MDKIIVIDVEECMACRTCEIECALAHSKSKTLEEAMKEVEPRVNVEGTLELWAPMMCRHCEDAPCIKICPTRAIHRDDPNGPVLIEQERCIGCNFCLVVCPFGVIDLDREGKALIKCDLCLERLQVDELPACVQACPTKALQFKTIEEVAAEKRKEYLIKFTPLDSKHLTGFTKGKETI